MISPNALIIMAKALASISINRDPFTDAEVMDSPQRDHWSRAMDEECPTILLNHTFTKMNSREATQLRVKPIGSKWVYKTHQQKTFLSGRKGCVRVDAVCQSCQRHPDGGLLHARRQDHVSRFISPSDRHFTVSSPCVGLLL